MKMRKIGLGEFKGKYSYDEECETLADHFLADEPHTQREAFDLAQHIQDAVEMWFVGRGKAGKS